jgi:transposase
MSGTMLAFFGEAGMSVLKTSGKERRRLEVFGRVKRVELSLRKAAELIGLSYRQTLRSYSRYRKHGDAGVVHRLRGKRSNRQPPAGVRKRVLALYAKQYSDFGPTLAAEHLAEEDGVPVSVSALRRWLVQAGLWKPRPRGARHRRWRERKPHFGEMVQVDGSLHDWFEGRRAKASLIVMIDDATNWMYARFCEEETTAAVMETFRRYVLQHGVPRSLYVDRDSIYETTRDATTDENLRETGALTQFGRALKDLEVQLILAYSPQAKGRVERRHGVLQDRLVKALRRRGISTLEVANDFLEATFLGPFNERFQVPPARGADLHRALPRAMRLDHILSYQERRVVQNDWTISWRNRCFQLTEANQRLALVRKSVLVCEHLDGSIHLWFRDRDLTWLELPERPPRPKNHRKAPAALKPHKPAASHPWRQPFVAPNRDE